MTWIKHLRSKVAARTRRTGARAWRFRRAAHGLRLAAPFCGETLQWSADDAASRGTTTLIAD
ncbi:hypothetical protein [Roseivivax lentus]|uniref:hypothetical protein n=1 Tax=Roseivivax lentus TaxID=633194 RepID=UPI00117B7B34|nr:hypothetical protein [Roseivivax lentus]